MNPNILAYLPWEGYNYEDAILISERLVSKDLFTSVHIEKHDLEVRQTKRDQKKFVVIFLMFLNNL